MFFRKILTTKNKAITLGYYSNSNCYSSLSIDVLKKRFQKFNKPNYYDYLVEKNPKISRLKRASVLGNS
jgi:hypothetical protein